MAFPSIALSVGAKLLPMYFLVLVGFVAGRVLSIGADTVGRLLVYVLAPGVVFFGILSMDLTPARLTLPLLYWGLCASLGSLAYFLLGRIPEKDARGVLGFAFGSGNTGYFGLPMTVALLGPDYVGLIVLAALGFILYENTLGFFFIARGKHRTLEALKAVAKLPALSAMVLAIFLNLMNVTLPTWIGDLPSNVRGAYSVLGMLLVGLGIGRVAERSRRFAIAPRLAALAALFRFVLWPLVTMAVLWVDARLGLYDPATRRLMPLIAVVPLPAITVAFAATFDVRPREIALLVLASTVLALAFIPIGLSAFAAWFP
jgi:predicted permease